MDTDCYFVETKKDPYKIIKENLEEFYDRPIRNVMKITNVMNKKAIRIYKDNLNGIPVTEYCGLRSKMYTYSFET